jgi:hypothetical protein
MDRYIIFWIPYRLPTFNPYRFYRKFIYNINIDDLGEWKVNLHYIPDIGNYYGRILVYDSITKEDLLILEIEDYNEFGFLSCKILYCDTRLEKHIDKTIYHFIKEFWHSHEFHSIEEDTLLRGLILSEKPSYKSYLNAYNHYLDIFYKKFLIYDRKFSERNIGENLSVRRYLKEIFKIWDLYKLTKYENDLNLYLGEFLYFLNFKNSLGILAKNHSCALKIITIESIAEFLKSKREYIRNLKNKMIEFWTLLSLIIGIISLIISSVLMP